MEQKQARRFTYSILVLIFAYSFVMSTPGLLTNGMKYDFNLSDVELGLVSSFISVGGLLALISVPLLQGRVRKWTMLLLSASVQAVLLICLGAAPVFWMLLASYMLLGAGMGWLDSYCNFSIVDINSGNSAKYMGALHGVFGVGAFLAPVAVQALLGVTGWRSINYISAGLMGLAIIFFIVQTGRDSGRANVSCIDEPRLKFIEIKEYLKDRYNLLLIGGGVMYSACQSVSVFWVVRYAAVSFGDEGAAGAMALSAIWLMSTISRFSAPHIKVRPLKLFAIGVSSIGVFQVAGVLLGSPAALIAAYGAIGLFSGLCMPMIMNEITIRYPGRTSLPTSVNMFMMYGARIVMPLIAGVLATYSSITISMLLPLITSVIGGLFALMAVRMDTERETKKSAAA